MQLEIREALLEDAPRIGRLLLELGYESNDATVRRRLERVLSQSTQVVLVAVSPPHGIVGVADASVKTSLASPPLAELQAFVVGSGHRESGVGRALLERVHGWALRRGIDHVVVAPVRHRRVAQEFFGKLGYTMSSERRYFTRDLSAPPRTGELTAMD